jgi:CheY-like chemotaxis protein
MKKILVVDDEEEILFSIKTGLESKSNEYKIQTATDGKKCLDLLNEEIPDLILLDLLMPNMDGWQVLDTVQGNIEWRDIPIFIITAVLDPVFKKSIEDLGIIHIEKPLTIDDPTEKIDNYFN